MLEDIRLSPEKIQATLKEARRNSGGKILTGAQMYSAIANAATDKAIEKMINYVRSNLSTVIIGDYKVDVGTKILSRTAYEALKEWLRR